MSTKEMISLHIGQAGVQIGNAVWELSTAEHSITNDGWENKQDTMEEGDKSYKKLFEETKKGKFIPRLIFCDLEPTVVDETRTGRYRELFHPDQLITGSEDSSNNFARGFFTTGKSIIEPVADRIRILSEQCDSLSCFLFYRSLSGGTGSGLTSAMLDYMVDYAKVPRVEMPIFASPTLAVATVEPYNCIMSQHFCIEDIDMSILMDNEALFDISSKLLMAEMPTMSNINRIIAQACSSLTASMRFPTVVDNNLMSCMTNLVPFPRIHFPLLNFSPITTDRGYRHDVNSIFQITRRVFDRDNQMMKVDPTKAKYMSCVLMYRGDVSSAWVFDTLSKIKSSRMRFVDWCPTGFKVGISLQPPTTIIGSLLNKATRNVAMLTNSACIGQAFTRINHKFKILYSKRAFVHWFVGEGMEEIEFAESLYNINTLVKDYEEASNDTDALVDVDEDVDGESVQSKEESQIAAKKDILREETLLSDGEGELDHFPFVIKDVKSEKIEQTGGNVSNSLVLKRSPPSESLSFKKKEELFTSHDPVELSLDPTFEEFDNEETYSKEEQILDSDSYLS